MTTIQEYLDKESEKNLAIRISRLEATDAPAPLLAALRAKVGTGAAHIGKIKKFGHLTFTAVSEHAGHRGKAYLRFENDSGTDILLVQGKWGSYLYRQKHSTNKEQ